MKHLKIRWPGALLCLLLCLLASCDGYNDSRARELIDRHDRAGSLTQDEYGELVDMSVDAMEHSLKTYEKLANECAGMSAKEYEEAYKKLKDEILDKYGCMEEIIEILSAAGPERLGTDNYNRWMGANRQFARGIKRISEKTKHKEL